MAMLVLMLMLMLILVLMMMMLNLMFTMFSRCLWKGWGTEGVAG